MRRYLIALASLALPLAAPLAAADTPQSVSCEGCKAALEKVAASPLRDADRARDAWRHPAQTLEFFGVTPGMKVGEYAPGGEWYSRFLGLYLGEKGRLVGLHFNPVSGPFKPESQDGIRKGAAGYPADVAKFTGLPAERFGGMTLETIPEAEKGTFDRIVVMRMLHNLMRWNIADSEIKAMRDLLKPGGMIGFEQHRAKADAPFSYADGSNGYLRQADVVKFMEINGFDFVASSEINANPKDSANWPDGVWTLPPTLALGDKDRAKYAAIGETDRMTLLFRKRD